MEIKVFKDVAKKENTYGGLTLKQWGFILGLVLYLIGDISNIFFQFLPMWLLRLLLLPLLGLVACNAMYKPHGFSYPTWLKLFIKFQTTIQIRTYQKEAEGMKKYRAKDFQKNRKIKEATTSKETKTV
ncbi:PrgI family mobile element protein [Enterococcus sp. DIV1420a]|uniref:PrgI family mobile element protein n=1 Tax=Enterococcus TaxID=1350 RepID=UPI003F233F0B